MCSEVCTAINPGSIPPVMNNLLLEARKE